jgi:GAF domain-containing protein
VVPNASEDARYVEPDRFQDVDARALIMAPIQAQGKAIGVLSVINPMARRFDADAATVMQGLGALAGATIRNAQLFEELERTQRHYLELFEESTDLVFVTDWEGKITENNRHAEQVTGFTRERLNSMGIGQLHHIDWNKVKGLRGTPPTGRSILRVHGTGGGRAACHGGGARSSVRVRSGEFHTLDASRPDGA